MTIFEGLPADADRILCYEEVVAFRGDILNPSIKWLKRGVDFVREAPVGSEFDLSETILFGETKLGVGISVVVCPEYLEDGDDCGRVVQIQVTTEFANPEMTEHIITAALAKKVDVDSEDLEQGLFTAWTVTEYYFDDTDDPFRVRSHHVLRGRGNEEVWSDECMGDSEAPTDPEDAKVTLSLSEALILEALQDSIEDKMTAGHREFVSFALLALGVPDSNVYSESEGL